MKNINWEAVPLIIACVVMLTVIARDALGWKCTEYSYEQQQCVKKELKQPKGDL